MLRRVTLTKTYRHAVIGKPDITIKSLTGKSEFINFILFTDNSIQANNNIGMFLTPKIYIN